MSERLFTFRLRHGHYVSAWSCPRLDLVDANLKRLGSRRKSIWFWTTPSGERQVAVIQVGL